MDEPEKLRHFDHLWRRRCFCFGWSLFFLFNLLTLWLWLFLSEIDLLNLSGIFGDLILNRVFSVLVTCAHNLNFMFNTKVQIFNIMLFRLWIRPKCINYSSDYSSVIRISINMGIFILIYFFSVIRLSINNKIFNLYPWAKFHKYDTSPRKKSSEQNQKTRVLIPAQILIWRQKQEDKRNCRQY